MNRGSGIGVVRSTTRTGRFNEAPIHESGKCVLDLPDRNALVVASMRPRFMNRGSPTELVI